MRYLPTHHTLWVCCQPRDPITTTLTLFRYLLRVVLRMKWITTKDNGDVIDLTVWTRYVVRRQYFTRSRQFPCDIFGAHTIIADFSFRVACRLYRTGVVDIFLSYLCIVKISYCTSSLTPFPSMCHYPHGNVLSAPRLVSAPLGCH